ncbi:MAG TPA: hypothetical protein PKE05_09540 [Microthrixaceae bacterium]|nr:hypothetical protein [Microthrixaceae bacterium]
MIRRVDVPADLTERITNTYGPRRWRQGAPSEWDFWAGPLAAALIAFRDFESRPFDHVPAIRRLTIVDPAFGALTFVGVLLADGVVEIADGQIDGQTPVRTRV